MLTAYKIKSSFSGFMCKKNARAYCYGPLNLVRGSGLSLSLK